jgi:hypothetical protein
MHRGRAPGRVRENSVKLSQDTGTVHTVFPMGRQQSVRKVWTETDRDAVLMLTTLTRLTLEKSKNKTSSVLRSWFSGTPEAGKQQNR